MMLLSNEESNQIVRESGRVWFVESRRSRAHIFLRSVKKTEKKESNLRRKYKYTILETKQK